ncbi:FHA domain-containing protein, partial [Myxococcota bacterium]|nr:FHA domain-containing protein [Myxococcota bacterium]
LPFEAGKPEGEFELADTVLADDISQIPGMESSEPSLPPGMIACPTCGTHVPEQNKFCGGCGSKISPRVQIPEPAPAAAPAPASAPVVQMVPKAKLIVQKPDGTQETVLELSEGETIIGRTCQPVFATDYYMSPQHAKVIIEHGAIFIEDLDSLNGTFFRITREELLKDGAIFRLGTEVLRFRTLPDEMVDEQGTEILGSPNLKAWGRLELIMGKEGAGAAYSLTGEIIKIGREEGDITFPDDGYVSGEHLELNYMDGQIYLVDLNSSNGSYLKISGLREVEPSVPILMGYQLYRIELI